MCIIERMLFDSKIKCLSKETYKDVRRIETIIIKIGVLYFSICFCSNFYTDRSKWFLFRPRWELIKFSKN